MKWTYVDCVAEPWPENRRNWVTLSLQDVAFKVRTKGKGWNVHKCVLGHIILVCKFNTICTTKWFLQHSLSLLWHFSSHNYTIYILKQESPPVWPQEVYWLWCCITPSSVGRGYPSPDLAGIPRLLQAGPGTVLWTGPVTGLGVPSF